MFCFGFFYSLLLEHSLQDCMLLLLGFWLCNVTCICVDLSNIAAVLLPLTKPQLRMDRFRV